MMHRSRSISFIAPCGIRKATVAIVLYFLSMSPIDGFCWESDVHFGLTRWLALQAGFTVPTTERIAKGDARLDIGSFDAVHLVYHYACLGHDENASRFVRQRHFPSDKDVGNPPEVRSVIPDSEMAWKAISYIVTNPGSDIEQELDGFGEALHTLQDSWSHQGVPDIPGVGVGPFQLSCDETLAWGHPQKRGGWSKHDADQTWRWRDDVLRMAEATFNALQRFLERHPTLRESPPRSWEQIVADIETFQSAKTKEAKSQWFTNQGFKNKEFIKE